LSSVGSRIPRSSKINSIFDNVSVIYSCSFNVSESKDEILTSFEAKSNGKTVSQMLIFFVVKNVKIFFYK
jgi:hypothetical protein